MPGYDVVAMDGLSIVGTLGFFVPAAVLVAVVTAAVVRDRRLTAREAEADREALAREALPDRDAPTPRAD